MPRPRIARRVYATPPVDYFKPRGIPMRDLDEVTLAVEELEAIRLADVEALDQAAAAKHMGVSRPTFARVLHSARGKVGDVLVHGKALRIEGGHFRLECRRFRCFSCGHEWDEPFGTGRPLSCAGCGGGPVVRMSLQDTESPRRNE